MVPSEGIAIKKLIVHRRLAYLRQRCLSCIVAVIKQLGVVAVGHRR